MRFIHDRNDYGSQYGWVGERYWFSIVSIPGKRGALYFDVGPWRIRWARPDYRPLFSERYGHRRCLRVGRLAASRANRARADTTT